MEELSKKEKVLMDMDDSEVIAGWGGAGHKGNNGYGKNAIKHFKNKKRKIKLIITGAN